MIIGCNIYADVLSMRIF